MMIELPDNDPKKRFIVEHAPCGAAVTTQQLDDANQVISQSVTILVTRAPAMSSIVQEL